MTKRKKHRKSEFKKWFEGQFGYRISAKPLEYHIDQEEKAHRAYIREKITVNKIHAWDQKFNDCLCAWQARNKRRKP